MQNPISDEQKEAVFQKAPLLFGAVQSSCYQRKHSIF